MKILILNHVNSLLKFGGGEVFNRNLIKTLLNNNHEVYEYVFYKNSNKKYEDIYNSEKYHLLYCPYFENNKKKISFFNISKIDNLVNKFIQNNNFDLILNNCGPENFKRNKKNKKWIQVIHDHPDALLAFDNSVKWLFPIKHIISNLINRGNFLKKTNAILFPDEEIQKYLNNKGRKYKKIKNQFVVPFPINETNKKVKLNNTNKNEVIWIGRIINNKKKNISFLNKVANELNKYNIKLNVCGEGPLIKKLKSKNIELKGWIDDGDKKFEVLSKKLCSLMPSKFEGFSLVVVESMFAGTPIVALDTFPSIKFHNKCKGVKLLKKNASPKEFADEIYKLKEMNNKNYDELRKETQDFYYKNLSLSIFKKKLIEVIEQMNKN